MKYPKEKELITERIMAVAKERTEFRRLDLITAYFGQHHTADWDEMLDYLVSEDKLYMVDKQPEEWLAQASDDKKADVPMRQHYSLQPFE